MKQGATGFLKIKIDDVIKIDEVSSIIFTVTTPDRDLQFKKSYPDDVAYEDGYYYIPLFQQDTVNMEGVYKIEAQINMKTTEVVKTTINKLFINSSLNTTMLDSNPSFRQIGSLVDMKVEGFAIGRDGENGATFIPVMTGTVLSWENDKGLENPQPVDLEGKQGPKGDPYTESQEFKDYYQKVKDTVNKSEQIDKDITDKSNAFNENYDSKLSSFNENSVNKTNDFDTNAETKTNEFNENATNKTTSFNQNAVEKTNTFNQTAQQQHDSLTKAFNDNATSKTNDFNAVSKKAQDDLSNAKTNAIKEVNDTKDKAIEYITNKGNEYDKRITKNENDISSIQEDIESNLTSQPLVKNKSTKNGYAYLTQSDNRKIKNMNIRGNTYQFTTKGYQLFNINDTVAGFIQSNGSTDKTAITNNEVASNDFLPIDSSKGTVTMRIKATVSNNYNLGVIAYYDENKTFISRLALTGAKGTGVKDEHKTFAIPSNAKYFKGSFRRMNDGQMQIEYGDTAHDFEVYTGGMPSPSPEYPQEVQCVEKINLTFKDNTNKTQTINYTLDKPLCKLSDSVYDYLDINRGKIVYKTGKLNLNTIQTWNPYQRTNSSQIYTFFIEILDIAYSSILKMNKLINIETCWDKDIPNVACIHPSYHNIYVNVSNIRDVESFKSWLQNNDIIVYYELTTPIEEDIPQELLTKLRALKTYYPVTFVQFSKDKVYPYCDIKYMENTSLELKSTKNSYDRSLGYACIDENVIGVQVDYDNGTVTRLAGSVGLEKGTDFDKFNMLGGRKRCNVTNDGTIKAYYGQSGFKEDGSNGQVMVYQPKFYYLVVPITYEPIDNEVGGYHLKVANYYVSDTPRPGFKVHPAFINEDGLEVDYILIGAYEASIYDTSANAYLKQDEQVADFDKDLLCSIANVKPCSGGAQNLTSANVEKLAKNRGKGWHSTSIKDVSMEQLLMIIELGTMNTQNGINQGVVSITDNTSYNCAVHTGSTSSLGNATGRATTSIGYKGADRTEYTGDSQTSISFRGVENFWGNMWKLIEGLRFWGNTHCLGGQPYVCKDFNYTENKMSGNYEAVGFTIPNSNGYIKAMGYDNNFDWLFIPSKVGGNSSKPVGDSLWIVQTLNKYIVPVFGGHWADGLDSGGLCLACTSWTSRKGHDFGGRLVYIPNLKNW